MTALRSELLPVAERLAETRSVEVLFVDDGSTDGTGDALAETFREPRAGTVEVRLERHERNRGLGAALKTGFLSARGSVAVTVDSDGSYGFTEIRGLLDRLALGADVVTASPYHPAGRVAGVPFLRLVPSRAASALYRLLVDRELHTYTCLFRAYRRSVFETVAAESDDFLAVTEILVKAKLLGYRVAEHPSTLRARRRGTSKARLAHMTLGHVALLSRILLHHLHLGRLERQAGSGVASRPPR